MISANQKDSEQRAQLGDSQSEGKSGLTAKPRIFVPSLYFAEGLPYTIVNSMSVVLYKNLGASNSFIGWATSFLYLPWTLKFLWSPFVDVHGTKKRWIVVSQMVLAFLTALLVIGTYLPDPFYVTVAIFLAMAVASATHDIAIDGYYLDILDKEQQALYVGVRNAFYKVAWLLGSGGLVFLAGKLAETTQLGIKGGWCAAFSVCVLLFIICAAFHRLVLPEPVKPPTSNLQPGGLTAKDFARAFSTWLDQPRILVVIAYILIFRAGDALMLKMAPPFLLDEVSKGGLKISTADLGIIYGTIGVGFLLVGGLFGGWLVSRFGLKACLFPTALIQNGAILLYWWLAAERPTGHAQILNLNVTNLAAGLTSNAEILRWFDAHLLFPILVNSVEQFAYGLGTAAYTVFLLTTVKLEFKAAHYAIATAIMAMGLMIPGAISGQLVDSQGYEKFFLISFLASIPGIITIFWLPLKQPETQHAKNS